MDRRESIKSLLVGSIAGGGLLEKVRRDSLKV